jgi:hypothetical protein
MKMAQGDGSAPWSRLLLARLVCQSRFERAFSQSIARLFVMPESPPHICWPNRQSRHANLAAEIA